MQKLSIVLLAALSIAGCGHTTARVSDAPVAHVVLLWLKEPGNAQDRQQVITASQQLAAIDGVIRLKVGQTVLSDRKVVDDSFDVGLYMEFASLQAMENYIVHPLHQRIVKELLAPVIDHYIAYDFEIDR